MIIIIRKETQLRRWMWAFMAHLSTIDKDSLTNIRDVSKVSFSFYFVDARNIDKQKKMNEHFIVVFSLDIYPYPEQKAFQFMTWTIPTSTPPPEKKNQVQLKKKLYSFFSLELQKTSIYQINMYAIPRFLDRILS